MTKKQYTEEFKEQSIKECQEVGNIALVARRHDVSPTTIYTWVRKTEKLSSTNKLPKNEAKRVQKIEKSNIVNHLKCGFATFLYLIRKNI
jgi:transposase